MSKHLESCSIRMPVSVVGGRGAFPLPSARGATAVVLCPSGPYSRGACYDGSSQGQKQLNYSVAIAVAVVSTRVDLIPPSPGSCTLALLGIRG